MLPAKSVFPWTLSVPAGEPLADRLNENGASAACSRWSFMFVSSMLFVDSFPAKANLSIERSAWQVKLARAILSLRGSEKEVIVDLITVGSVKLKGEEVLFRPWSKARYPSGVRVSE